MIDPKKSLLLAMAALSAVVIAGCGGGGGGDTETTAPVTTEETTAALSKEDLIQEGDGICAEVNAAVGTVGDAESEENEEGAQNGTVAQGADLYGGMVERLKALGEPAESSPEYTEFIEAADELDQAQSDAKLASERGEETALAEAQTEASSALARFQEAALAYGFEDCAEAPSAPVATGGVPGSEEEAAPEEVAPEEVAPEEVAPEEAAPEEVAPETGGAGAGGGTGTGGGGAVGGGESGGIGPG